MPESTPPTYAPHKTLLSPTMSILIPCSMLSPVLATQPLPTVHVHASTDTRSYGNSQQEVERPHARSATPNADLVEPTQGRTVPFPPPLPPSRAIVSWGGFLSHFDDVPASLACKRIFMAFRRRSHVLHNKRGHDDNEVDEPHTGALSTPPR